MHKKATQTSLRSPVHELAGADLLDQLREELPSYALEYLDSAFVDHDEQASSRLVSAAPNAWRGEIALCAFWLGTPTAPSSVEYGTTITINCCSC